MAPLITTQTQENIMSNPYQIRTDVLAMAKDMLDKQYDTQMKIAQTMFEANKENMDLATEAWNKYIPKCIPWKR